MMFFLPVVRNVAVNAWEGFLRSWIEPVSQSINRPGPKDPATKEQNPQASGNSAPSNPANSQAIASMTQAPIAVAPGGMVQSNLPMITARIVKVNAAGIILSALSPQQNIMLTGERFIVEYATSMPGLVLSQNRDGSQQVTALNSTQVGSLNKNKLPMEDESYTLEGESGIETFRLLFLPCTNASGGDGGASLADLGQTLASATQPGGAFEKKAITIKANEKLIANAATMLTPTAMKSMGGCDKARLDAAAAQAFNSLGSKVAVQGQATLAQSQQEGQVVELLLTINHQKPGP
jgi:hypothetical protein